MLRTIALLLALLLTGAALAENPFVIETEIPDEPFIEESERATSVAEYDPEAGLSRYTLTLKDGAQLADGSELTLQDVLFSLYVRLDPGRKDEGLAIPGLAAYRLQRTEEDIADALAVAGAIDAAGPDHAWSAEDGWTEAEQSAWWDIQARVAEAGAEGFPALAGIIRAYAMGEIPSRGAMDFTADEIAADEGLQNAWALLDCGYARYEDGVLTDRLDERWNLADGERPASEVLAELLSALYGGDLARCWAVECPDRSAAMPELPDAQALWLEAALQGREAEIASIRGIRPEDDRLVVELEGIDLRSASRLFGVPMSLDAAGDEALWSPEDGLYGHPFGETEGIAPLPGEAPLFENTNPFAMG